MRAKTMGLKIQSRMRAKTIGFIIYSRTGLSGYSRKLKTILNSLSTSPSERRKRTESERSFHDTGVDVRSEGSRRGVF